MITLDDAYEVIDRLRVQRDAAQDAVVGLQGERSALRALLETERHRSSIAKAEAADLRRQLAKEREQWRQLAQDTQYYIEEAADLRRQLAEAQAEGE